MRNTFSIQCYCRTSKADRKGLAPIELSINCNGKRVFLNMQMKVKPEEFNRKRQPQYIVDYCDQVRIKANTIMGEMLANNTPITSESLREAFRSGGVRSFTVGDCIDGYFQIKQKEMLAGKITSNHYRKLEYARDYLLKYVNREQEITVITPSLIQNIYADLQIDYMKETSAGYMTRIKSIVRYAMDNGKLQINPLAGLKIEKAKPTIEFLTEEEVERIANTIFPVEHFTKVRDLFLFSCGCGLSYSDCRTLKPEDFKLEDGATYISKGRNKTDIQYTAVLLPFAEEIAKKYNYDISSIVISNQKINAALKYIQSICQIKTRLHFHLARKTYACLLLNKGVAMDVVSKTLGHSTVKITQSAYARFLNTTIINAVKAAI